MRFNIVISALLALAIQIASASKGRRDKKAVKGSQKVKIDNNSKSDANSLAVKAWCVGNANSKAHSNSANTNVVNQNVVNKKNKKRVG